MNDLVWFIIIYYPIVIAGWLIYEKIEHDKYKKTIKNYESKK